MLTNALIALVILTALAGAFFMAVRKGMWKQRAKTAEDINEANREAISEKNRVRSDPSYRERVRKRFRKP